MIAGVGLDLVSIGRIEKAFRRRPERFISRIYTWEEKEAAFRHGNPFPALAARFAAKEAVLKAIGCGIGPAGPAEVEVISVPGKPPRVRLRGHAAVKAGRQGITSFEISLTHDPPFACAVAIALKDGKADGGSR